MNPPSFLFIVPTLNSYAILPRLVSSLQSQLYTNWRVVFVDGNSSKNHHDYLNVLCEEDKRFSWITESSLRSGIFGAMNDGITIANDNDWIYFWGSDDWAYNENILKNLAYEIKESTNKPDLIVCKARYFNMKTKRMARESFFIKNSQTKVISRIYFKFLLFLP